VILCEMNLVLENRNMHDWAMRECWTDCVCVCVFFFFFFFCCLVCMHLEFSRKKRVDLVFFRACMQN